MLVSDSTTAASNVKNNRGQLGLEIKRLGVLPQSLSVRTYPLWPLETVGRQLMCRRAVASRVPP